MGFGFYMFFEAFLNVFVFTLLIHHTGGGPPPSLQLLVVFSTWVFVFLGFMGFGFWIFRGLCFGVLGFCVVGF